MKKIILLLGLLLGFQAFSQVPARHRNGVAIGDPSGTSADPASLELSGTDKAVLYYNETLGAIRMWDGVKWVQFATSGTIPPRWTNDFSGVILDETNDDIVNFGDEEPQSDEDLVIKAFIKTHTTLTPNLVVLNQFAPVALDGFLLQYTAGDWQFWWGDTFSPRITHTATLEPNTYYYLQITFNSTSREIEEFYINETNVIEGSPVDMGSFVSIDYNSSDFTTYGNNELRSGPYTNDDTRTPFTLYYMYLDVNGTVREFQIEEGSGTSLEDTKGGTAATYSGDSGTTGWEIAGQNASNLGLEGYTESGTRVGGDLIVTLGDYDDSGIGTKITIDDANETISFTGDAPVVNLPTTTLVSGAGLYFDTGSFWTVIDGNTATANRTIVFPDASGTLALTSDIGIPSLTENEIAFGDGSNQMTSDSKFKFFGTSVAALHIGNSTDNGSISLFGDNGSNGGFMNFYNSDNNDTNTDYYRFRAQADFEIYNGSGNAFVIDESTAALSAPLTSNADITALGNTALITKEYGDANYLGGGASQLSDLTDVNTSTPTNRNVLVADGVDWESRALVEADISDLGTYLTSEVDGSVVNEGALTVGAGTGSTSLISSNTSGSTPVTITAGTNMTISEAGNVITLNSTASGATNLSSTHNNTTVDIESDTGTNTTINLANGTTAGVSENNLTDGEKTILGNTSGTNSGDNAVNSLYSGLVSNATHTGDVTGSTALTIATDAVDLSMLSATGTASASTYLRGDNTWSTITAGGDVSKVGTPVNDEVGIWTGDGTLEGDPNFTYNSTNFSLNVGGLNNGMFTMTSGGAGVVQSSTSLDIKTDALSIESASGDVVATSDGTNMTFAESVTVTTGDYIDADGTDSTTGTILNLSDNITGKIYNEATPSTATAFTTSNLKAGGFAYTYINSASEPTVDGSSTETGGSVFEASTLMKLVAYSPDGTTVEHFFVSLGTPSAGSSSPLTTKGDVYTYSTVDARLGVGTNGQVLTADSAEATGLKWATPTTGVTELSKTITIESPTSSEDISIFFTNKAITVTEVRAITVGTSPSTTWKIYHETNRSSSGNDLIIAGTTTTSQSSGNDLTSFDDATIVADSFIWLETSAQSGTVQELSITIFYTED